MMPRNLPKAAQDNLRGFLTACPDTWTVVYTASNHHLSLFDRESKRSAGIFVLSARNGFILQVYSRRQHAAQVCRIMKQTLPRLGPDARTALDAWSAGRTLASTAFDR